jgi:hypothetical protein
MTGRRRGSTVEQPINLHAEQVYEITVKGEINLSWLRGFGEVDVQTEHLAGGGHQCTRSRIVTDQAGLVGLIRRLHGLGVALVSVRQAPEADAPVTIQAVSGPQSLTADQGKGERYET